MTPFKHQEQSLAFLAPRDYVFDMSEPGTGKTAVHLWDFERKHKLTRKAGLVLAPRSLLTAAWAEDAKRFTPNLRVSVAYASNRVKAFETEADLYITNHDAAKWLDDQPVSFFRRFGHLKVDESTAYKNKDSQRSKAANRIRGLFETCDVLCGTPSPNGVLDIWHQAYLLDRGKRLGSTYFGFRNAVCDAVAKDDDGRYVEWVVKEGAEDAIAARLADISIRHRLRDVVELPEQIFRMVKYDLAPKHRAIYQKMERDSVVHLDDTSILAVNGAVLWGKLLQIASGSVYGVDDTALVDDERYHVVMELANARRHSIVVFQWGHQREKLKEIAEKNDISYAVIDGDTSDKERARIVKAFQDGWYRVLFGHPQSMAHGLTLTRGEAVIWASPTINLEWWEQANRRILRIGQDKRTETIVVTARDTRDEDAYERCMGKQMSSAEFLHRIKEYYSA